VLTEAPVLGQPSGSRAAGDGAGGDAGGAWALPATTAGLAGREARRRAAPTRPGEDGAARAAPAFHH